MIRNRYPSPVIVYSSDDDAEDDADSRTESDSSWGRPQNQLGLTPAELGLEPAEHDDTDSSTESDSSWGKPDNQLGSRRDDEEAALEDRVDCAIQVSPGDGCDDQEADGSDNQEAALDKKDGVDCAIQVSPGDDPKKETATNIDMKSSSENRTKEKQDVNINIAISPGSSNPIIDIKFTTEIKIRKRMSSKEPVGERKRKRARSQ